jgi:Pyruvate/2-oxoacid:ferredoxin oxidoreductase delta subunit
MKEKKITLQNKKSDLRRLVMMMNKQNKKFFPPIDELLKSIDYVLTGEELGLLLRLGTDIYSYEQAAVVCGLDPGKFKPLFESLKQKGFIGIKYTQTDEERYSLHPIIVGWFEAQVSYLIGKPDEKEFARRWMEFVKSGRKYNFFPLRNIMNMTIRKAPVSNQSVGLVHETKDAKGKSIVNINHTINVPDSKIYPTNSVNDLIHEYGTKSVIGQLTCMCRRVTLNLDDPCRLKIPDDGGCLGFGKGIIPAIKYGYARQISKEEAFDVLQKVRDKGAIHTVFHEKGDAGFPQVGICNCCGDCCGILRSYNVGSVPLRYSSFYMAKIADSTKCTGCKKCEKYCPTVAISIVDKKASIDEKKCIGCGQCVHQCSFSAVELIENKRTAFLPMLKKSEARITT